MLRLFVESRVLFYRADDQPPLPDQEPPQTMPSFKEQSFQERAALAAKAKQAALDKLRAKPPVDEAVVAARVAAAKARDEAAAAKREAMRIQREEEAAAKRERAAHRGGGPSKPMCPSTLSASRPSTS